MLGAADLHSTTSRGETPASWSVSTMLRPGAKSAIVAPWSANGAMMRGAGLDVGALKHSRTRMLGSSSRIELRVVHAGSAGRLLPGAPKLQALAYSSHALRSPASAP